MTQFSKHFVRSQFACRCGCGYDTVDHGLVDLLERLRDRLRAEVMILEGARCSERNAAVGAGPGSLHLQGRAVHIRVPGYDPHHVAIMAAGMMDQTGGIGIYADWVHIDTRSEPLVYITDEPK